MTSAPATMRGTDTFDIHADTDEQSYESAREGVTPFDYTDQSSDGDLHPSSDGEGIHLDSLSDDSDEVVDELVAEDIDKFTETFKGIGQRFRLINRIGEGECLAAPG